MPEVELKFLHEDIPQIIRKIEALGATKEYSENETSYYFFHEGMHIGLFHANKGSLRLRSRGEKHVLTYKSPMKDHTFKMQDEHETLVGNKEEMLTMLAAFGFSRTKPITRKRTHYKLDSFSFEIDEYPGKAPYLEVEAKSIDGLKSICEKLELDIAKGTKEAISHLFPELFVLEK